MDQSIDSASWLATLLDQEMLENVSQIAIAPRSAPNAALQRKTGAEVSAELRGRPLLRYLVAERVQTYEPGRREMLYTTPTAYSGPDATSWLALPNPQVIRTHVMLLDPGRIAEIWGPRWVRLGKGIEYLLPQGFPAQAIILGWPILVS